MKKAALFAFLLSGIAVSCEKPEPNTVLPASVEIKVESTTSTSISFVLNPENAVEMSYAVAVKGSEEIPEFTLVESGDTTSITVSDLLEETDYIIYANATNIKGEVCDNVSVDARTTSSAQISIELVEARAKELTFKLTPVNAARYGYAVSDPSSAETCKLTMVENGDENEYTIENLTPATNYTIVAQAFAQDGTESERTYRAVRTETDAVVTIDNVSAEDIFAKAEFTTANVSALYYAVVPSGEEPVEDNFSQISLSEDGTSSVSFYELTPESDYTVHMYGVSGTGYVGDTVSADFTTLAEMERDMKVVISDITSLDATVTVTFDEEKYSRIHWIANTPDVIGDPSAFDWNNAVNVVWTAKTINTGNNGYPLSLANSFSNVVKPGVTIRVGFCPADPERTILTDQAQWYDVTFSNLQFGESDATVQINQTYLSHREIRYTITTENAAGYYIGIADPSWKDDLEMFISSRVLQSELKTDFGTERTSAGDADIKIGTDGYQIVVVPVDEQNRMGNYVTYEFASKSINTDGKGQVNVELIHTDYTYFKFDCTLDDQTETLYYFVNNGEFTNDDDCIEELVCGFNYLTESNTAAMVVDKCNTDYDIYFCAVDKDGNMSEIWKQTMKTKTPEFDGTGTVDVQVTSDGLNYTVTTTPDENISRYWVTAVTASSVAEHEGDDTWFVNNACYIGARNKIIGKDPTYDSSEYLTGPGEISGVAYGSNYIVVVAEDTAGKLIPVIKTPIGDIE